MSKTGLFISTYAGLPFVHLQLESWHRNTSGMDCLIIDDCSEQRERIKALCDEYGAEFHCNPTRMNHVCGDMLAFCTGLDWATRKGMAYVVKFSRRWIPLTPWTDEMLELFSTRQACTLNARCTYHGFGFRSECVAMNVHDWNEGWSKVPIMDQIRTGTCNLVEAVIHRASQLAFEKSSPVCRDYAATNPNPPGCGGYIQWPWMKESRVAPRADVLWHEWAASHEVHRALLQWGVDSYSTDDFVDLSANIKR